MVSDEALLIHVVVEALHNNPKVNPYGGVCMSRTPSRAPLAHAQVACPRSG